MILLAFCDCVNRCKKKKKMWSFLKTLQPLILLCFKTLLPFFLLCMRNYKMFDSGNSYNLWFYWHISIYFENITFSFNGIYERFCKNHPLFGKLPPNFALDMRAIFILHRKGVVLRDTCDYPTISNAYFTMVSEPKLSDYMKGEDFRPPLNHFQMDET